MKNPRIPCPKLAVTGLLLVVLVGMDLRAPAAEYHVTKSGSDANRGTPKAAAWATIQKGVNSLQPGDTLVIGPGEYSEAIKRVDLGSLAADTIIRAELPGTVLLRGDVPAPAFRPLPGHRFVYVADFKFTGAVPAVNETDTLTILQRGPNSSELEFLPGTFYHDTNAGQLFISPSDLKPASIHHYSVSVIPTHGIHLLRPKRVVLEGLSVTGFSAMGLLHYREETAGGVWGIYLGYGKSCVIRDCRAYLNAWGIGSHSGALGSGDNVIEGCVAWGNKSAFANGDMGGITAFAARRDTIRNSTAFLNGMYGINIYGTGGAPPGADDGGNDPKHKSLLANNLAWGNETADIKIKTGYEYHHTAENCVAPGLWSVINVRNGLVGREAAKDKERLINNLVLSEFPALDLQREFADPDHHDYRLQATSRFRSNGPEGRDRGPFPYETNIFYLRPDGDDQADGLSLTNAWRTLRRAVPMLRPGHTLYLASGTYPGDLVVEAQGQGGRPIAIRARGKGSAVIEGNVRVNGSTGIEFQRLSLHGAVAVGTSVGITFEQCEFSSPGTSLTAIVTRELRVSHCLFTGFRAGALRLRDCSGVDLRGNLYDNAKGPAVLADRWETVLYSSYPSYCSGSAAWEVAGKQLALSDLPKNQDQQSRELTPEFAPGAGITPLKNAPFFAAGGPLGKPVGPYRDELRRRNLRLAAKPEVHSVSATTANLEWTTSLPATCHLAWGETPACERATNFNVNYFGTFSLTGLQPGHRYYFRIKAIETPNDMLPKSDAKPVELADEPITFTTMKTNAVPATYHVAVDGDDARSGRNREQAWRTIRHAAARVNVGDTVLIAGGRYSERIRIRATGEQGEPITFKSLPGERVEVDGDNMVLNSAFVVGGKSHLRFDGFYLAHFNLFPNDGWSLQYGAEFHLYRGRDIAITRCFSEGRGGYSAAPVAAWEIDGLLVKNCVNTYKFGGMYFWRCPNLRIENTVFAEPMIMAFVLRNDKRQSATFENCIFTDMLEKKAKLNIGVLCCDGEIDSFRQRNNCYFLRDCIPLEQRALQGSQTISQLGKYIVEPLFADPRFAGDPGVKGNPHDKSGFSPDRMMDAPVQAEFDPFFATHPELLKRGIGLQPEAFRDFNRPATNRAR